MPGPIKRNIIAKKRVEPKKIVVKDEVTITIKVKNCRKCPFLNTEKTPGRCAEDWYCSKKKNKCISEYIEWPREEPKAVPDWCPYRNKKEE